MHVEDGHAAVNHIHTVQCKYVGDRSAATEIDTAELSRLVYDARLVKRSPDFGNILGICIIGTGLAS